MHFPHRGRPSPTDEVQLTAYQARLKTYIDAQPGGATATVGDVIGKKIIAQDIRPLLAGSAPYSVQHLRTLSTSVPQALEHRFTYKLYASAYDRYDDNPLLSFTDKTVKLVGKRVTLSYAPASQADADLIASYLPRPHADGSPIQPGELPTSLPGYLIRLKAQISVDGKVVAKAADATTMGTDLYSLGGFTQLYDPSQWDLTTEESNVAGQATAIGISAGGISAQQLKALKDRLQTTVNQIQTSNIQNISGEQTSGDLLTATIWSWFAAAESLNLVSQNQAGVIESPGLSYGLFHAVVNPFSSWGVVRKVTFPGVNLDIGHIRNLTWAKDNDSNKWVAYNRLRGKSMSALEHAVPERFFGNPSQCNLRGSTTAITGLPECPQGISAVKALGLAAAQGQKIYTITQKVYKDNPNIVRTALSAHSQNTQQKVQESLDAGLEVTIHERPITESGWSGAGYMVIDSGTGAGAYLIDGGANGVFLIVFGAILMAIGIYGVAAAVAAGLILTVAGSFIVFAGGTLLGSDKYPEIDACTFFVTAALGLLALVLGVLILGTAGIVIGFLVVILMSIPSTSKGISELCSQ